MELTPEQENAVRRIMAVMCCPKGFQCHEEKFENLCRIVLYEGANLVQCQSVCWPTCRMSYVFHDDIRFCKCRLRWYLAVEFGR